MRDERVYKANFFRFSAVTVFLGLLLTMPAVAQLPTGTILGVVKDASGAVVPGANMTARNLDTGVTRTTVSSGDGSYRFPALAVGTYEVRAEHTGFQVDVRSGLKLAVGQEAVLNFALVLGTIEQQVAVTAEAPLVNTTSGSLGGLVSEQRIEDLPLNGRNYVDLSLLQPGISQQKNVGTTAGMGGVWYSSNGAPPRSNSYLLDGASMVNMFGGTASSVAGTALGVEGIREYKVVTNSFSAEYGLTMGSQMTIVSKSGTNTFHGSAFEYLRNSAMDAANFFDSTPVVSPGHRIAPVRRNQFGGSVGGPVRKDKSFFFVTYEGLRDMAGQSQVLNVIPANCFSPATHAPLVTSNPCATGSGGNVAASSQPLFALFPYPNLPSVTPGAPANRFGWIFPQPTTENYGQARVDHNFSSADNFFIRYTVDDTQTTHATGLYPQFTNPWLSRGQFGTLSENHVFSAALLNTARVSFSRTNIVTDSLSGISNATRPGTSFVCSPVYSPNCQEIGSLGITGLTAFAPDIASPAIHAQNIFAFSDDVFYSRGRHSLKFGVLLNHYQQIMFDAFSFKGGVTYLNVPNFLAGVANQYTLADPAHNNTPKFYSSNSLGFYGQDDLRLWSNFTLNLGLRYEFATVPSERYGHSSSMRFPNSTDTPTSAVLGAPYTNPSLLNFSPRLGFAWDVFGNGKTSVRGGFTEVYDLGNIASALVQGAIGTPPFSQQATIAAPSAASQIPVVLPLVVPAGYTPALRIVDYNLSQPHMLQYNLSVERQLPGRTALTVAYAGSRGLDLFQVQDGNPRFPISGTTSTWPIAPRTVAPRLNPSFGSITFLTTAGDSWYNSLQVGLVKQLSKGLQFQSAYTWSKSLDDTQGQLPNDTGGVNSPYNSNPFSTKVDRGPSGFDTTQNWRFNLVYRLPDVTQQNLLGKFVNGWRASGIVTAQTGYPFSPVMSTNTSGSGVNNAGGGIDRPNITAGFNAGNAIVGTPNQWFNPAAFTAPSSGIAGVGVLGYVSRGFLRGPGLVNLDFSLAKDTAIKSLGEGGRLEFRAEFFNILNHPNFAMPAIQAAFNGTATGTGNAGQITSTSADSRRIQLALKLLF